MRRSVVTVLLAVLALTAACNPFATKGTVPPPPPGGGVVDPQQYPDYIAALNREGTALAGYVPKACLFPSANTGPGIEESCPVYAGDLFTLVGHMVPGRGFVPLGVDPADVPEFPMQAGSSPSP